MSTNAVVSLVDDCTALDYVVMMQSLRDANPQLYNTIDKHIFTFGSLCDENKSIIQTLFPGVQETIIKPPSDKISYSGDREWGKAESTAYRPHYRYEIFNLTQYDNLVYLDTDLLIQGNIEKLFTTPPDKVQACKKWPQETRHSPLSVRYKNDIEERRLCRTLDDPLGSFNGGVLSLGKDILTPDTKHQLLKLQKEKNTPGNQQILNIYFQDLVEFLPQTYNFATEFYSEQIFHQRPPLDDQHIIHFVGPIKPSHGLKPHTRKMERMELRLIDPDSSIFRKIEKYVLTNPSSIIKLSFGDYQQECVGEEGCLELWLRWFKILKSTGVFIKPKKDSIITTHRVE
jgi:lipopolysaccharide biosynthesis glycosyltransferase